MPPRRGRFSRPPPRRAFSRDSGGRGRIAFVRRAVPLPAHPLALRPLASGAAEESAAADRWELVCRDGWEWQRRDGDLVLVRVATLTADQAAVVQDWIERIKRPAAWWAVSRELHSPGTSPEVGRALAEAPWLAEVLPALLEASCEGAPPPPDA
jgi:hypothetical protein